jgi:hypothetical protein
VNDVVSRVRLIRKVRYRVEDNLRDTQVCSECLDEFVDQLVKLENQERDHDEMGTIEDPELGF